MQKGQLNMNKAIKVFFLFSLLVSNNRNFGNSFGQKCKEATQQFVYQFVIHTMGVAAVDAVHALYALSFSPKIFIANVALKGTARVCGHMVGDKIGGSLGAMLSRNLVSILASGYEEGRIYQNCQKLSGEPTGMKNVFMVPILSTIFMECTYVFWVPTVEKFFKEKLHFKI